MSTCPVKDIHSLYADNELQEPFKTELENHTANCPHCQKISASYRLMREKIAEDSNTLSFSPQELDESYMRLKARLSYKKFILSQQYSFTGVFTRALPTVLTAAAAAAVFAFAALFPIRFFGAKASYNQPFAHIKQNSSSFVRAEPIQKRGIIVTENVDAASLAAMLGTHYRFTLNTPQLTAIDVFKPELSVNTVQIQIPLSTVAQMPLISEGASFSSFSLAEDLFR